MGIGRRLDMWRLNMTLLVGLASRLVEDAAWGRVVDLLDSNMQQQKTGTFLEYG